MLCAVGPLFHIAKRTAWEAARSAGEYRPASLLAEGFIHLSTEDQWRRTLDRCYREDPDLVVLCIDPGRLGNAVRFEPVDGESFPHLYGPLAVDAVVRVRDAPRLLPVSPAVDRQIKVADPAVDQVLLCSVDDRGRTVTYVCLAAKPGRAGAIGLREVMLAVGALPLADRAGLAECGWMQLHSIPRAPDGNLDEPALLAYVEGLIADD
jgi:uncharacterized protein (DUF952 family)